jgi:hypothetical protein
VCLRRTRVPTCVPPIRTSVALRVALLLLLLLLLLLHWARLLAEPAGVHAQVARGTESAGG